MYILAMVPMLMCGSLSSCQAAFFCFVHWSVFLFYNFITAVACLPIICCVVFVLLFCSVFLFHSGPFLCCVFWSGLCSFILFGYCSSFIILIPFFKGSLSSYLHLFPCCVFCLHWSVFL